MAFAHRLEECVDVLPRSIVIHMDEVGGNGFAKSVVKAATFGEVSVRLQHVRSEIRRLDFFPKGAPGAGAGVVLGDGILDGRDVVVKSEAAVLIRTGGNVFRHAFGEPTDGTVFEIG